ncbi:hypothetical protein GCM10007937_17440 [Mesorhizobium albiziae]|nr:hypothetical protein GCM10007937_17440 [Mesorhizobium albiziae]
MRDVDDAHDAEHQRQAERSQRQHSGCDKAFQRCEQEVREKGHSGDHTLKNGIDLDISSIPPDHKGIVV